MEEKKHFISNSLHNSLNVLTVIEERALYLLVDEIKRKYYKDKQVSFDQELSSNDKIYEVELDGKVVRDAIRQTFKTLRELLLAIPSRITILYENDSGKVVYLFRRIEYDGKTDVFKIKLNDEFYDYIYVREVKKEFFIIHSPEFDKISTVHGQALYRLCSRFLNQKNYLMKIETLKEYFRLGKKYKTADIVNKILEPGIEKIHVFTNFRIKYKKRKKGKEITHILFTFTRVEDREQTKQRKRKKLL